MVTGEIKLLEKWRTNNLTCAEGMFSELKIQGRAQLSISNACRKHSHEKNIIGRGSLWVFRQNTYQIYRLHCYRFRRLVLKVMFVSFGMTVCMPSVSSRQMHLKRNPVGSIYIIPNRFGELPSDAHSPRMRQSTRKKTRGRPRKNVPLSFSAPSSATNLYQKYYPIVLSTYDVERYSHPLRQSVRQARSSAECTQWLSALKSEFDSMRTSGTFVPLSVPLSDIGQYEIIHCKLIFDKRDDPDGSFKIFKARLVAPSDLQHHCSELQTYAALLHPNPSILFLLLQPIFVFICLPSILLQRFFFQLMTAQSSS